MESKLIQQYRKVKKEHQNAIVIWAMGDYCQVFEKDAKKVSEILGTTLTKDGNNLALTGFPKNKLNDYLEKLVKKGNKVALVEKPDPRIQHKTIKRDIGNH